MNAIPLFVDRKNSCNLPPVIPLCFSGKHFPVLYFLSPSVLGVHTHPFFLFLFSLSLVFFSFLYDTIILLHSIQDNHMFAALSPEYMRKAQSCPSHNSKYKKTARIIFWRPVATKRFLRFFLSFITTKQFFAGITTALICVGLSVFFFTMHNFISISCALFCAYITIYPLISRKHPESTWQTGLLPSTDPSSPYSPRRQYNAPAGRSWEGFHHLMLIFS